MKNNILKNKEELLALVALLFILIVAADLRLLMVDSVPGWYNDEGSCINLAANLLKGRIEYFGVQGSLLFPARMPLFIWLLALVFRIFGTDITVLRLLTGSMGVISTAVIYFMLRKEGQPLALICALAYAIFPKAVLYSRFGFSYNLLGLLVILLFWACGAYLDTGKKRYAILASIIVSLCLISELIGTAYLIVFILVILWKRWKDIWFALPIAVFPFLIYTSVMLWLYPQAYRADLQYALGRVSDLPLPAQLVTILVNSGSIHNDLYFLIGAIGIFFSLHVSLKKRLVLFLVIPLLVFTRTIGVGTLGWYYLIPLFPFYAIGVGLLIYKFGISLFNFSIDLFNQIFDRVQFNIPGFFLRLIRPASNLSLIILFIITPFFFSALFIHLRIVYHTNEADLVPFLADISEAKAVINYLNSHANPEDVILISPSMGWALKANAVDYHISLAYMGLSTRFFPNDVSHNRFRFNPSYTHAKYIVIDNLWMNWGEPNLPDLIKIRKVAEASARKVFQTKDMVVYEEYSSK